MTDNFKIATIPNQGLSIGIALTTATCREAARLHELKSTSSIALGRLISCTAIAGLMQDKPGGLSMQIVSNGRLKQIFADVTVAGQLRGYVFAHDLDLPLFSTEAVNGRRSIAAGVMARERHYEAVLDGTVAHANADGARGGESLSMFSVPAYALEPTSIMRSAFLRLGTNRSK